MLLPASATPDARRIVFARALRGLADGFVSVYLAQYLGLLGLSALEVGAIVTCAGHVRQLGGESPLPNLTEVKG